jgi:hypothetical protein
MTSAPSRPPAPLSPWHKRLWGALFSLALTFVLLELSLALLCARGRLPIQRPSYCPGNVWSRFWADLNPDFGVWHAPNSTYTHVSPCFRVTYHANAHGMRDRERNTSAQSRRRVVVLGDSFIEGWGVATDDRLSDRLERATGLEHLNFGTSGSFGPTQEYLLYKTLARTFEHDAVIVALLPDNDFLDDDYVYGRAMHQGRLRPYFVGQAPDYRIEYLPKGKDSLLARLAENGLRQFTYTGNLIKYMKSIKRHQASAVAPDYAGYYDFTPDQWVRMEKVLTELKHEAGSRPILVLTIPCDTDFRRCDTAGEPPLPGKLRALCSTLGMQYLDLLPAIRTAEGGWESCYLACDRHWNAHGNAVAAAAVEKAAAFYEERKNRR